MNKKKRAQTTASRKAKGRIAQQHVVEVIKTTFPQLTQYDVSSCPMGVNGPDVVLSTIGREIFPYSVEVKNTEKLNIWKALKQAESENRDLEPMVVFKRNHTDYYAALKFDTIMHLIGNQKKKED